MLNGIVRFCEVAEIEVSVYRNDSLQQVQRTWVGTDEGYAVIWKLGKLDKE